MGSNIRTFEVRVEVSKKGSKHFSSHIGKYIENKVTEMFHFDARTSEQAKRMGKKYGRPISVRKVDVDRMRGNIEALLSQLQPINPYPDAIAMDEFIWRRKNKRDGRRRNRDKDKNGY